MTARSSMDVLFVIDATGSMGDALKTAHDHAATIAADLKREHPTTDFRYGSVCFRDPVDDHRDIHEVCEFTEEIQRLVTFFGALEAWGGRDEPEDWVGALKHALDLKWRENSKKMLILMADAPAHGERFCGVQNHEDQTPLLVDLIQKVAQRKIMVQAFDIGRQPDPETGAKKSFDEFERIYTQAGGPKYSYEWFRRQYPDMPAIRTVAVTVDVLGRNVNARDYPQDYPSDDDYDSDEDTHGLPQRRKRAGFKKQKVTRHRVKTKLPAETMGESVKRVTMKMVGDADAE